MFVIIKSNHLNLHTHSGWHQGTWVRLASNKYEGLVRLDESLGQVVNVARQARPGPKCEDLAWFGGPGMLAAREPNQSEPSASSQMPQGELSNTSVLYVEATVCLDMVDPDIPAPHLIIGSGLTHLFS